MPTSFKKHLSRFLLGGRSNHKSSKKQKKKQKQKQTKQHQMRIIIGTKEEDETHESVVAEENDGKDEKEEQEQQEHDSPRSKTTKTSNFHVVEEVEEEEAPDENDDQKIDRMMTQQLHLQQQQEHLQQQIQELDQQINLKKKKQQRKQKKKQQQKVILEPSVSTEAVETAVTTCSLLSQSPGKELHTSIMIIQNTMQPSSNLASPCQDDHDNDFGFDGDAFSIRSIISGLTELTHDHADATKGRRRRERERRVLTGSSSTTSIPKTIAFATLSGNRSSKKLDAPLSPSTTMTTMMTIDEDDTNGNTNGSRRNEQLQTSSSTTGQRNEVSSLLLERLLRKENVNSLSTQRFELSFQNNNTATELFPMD